MDPIDRLREIVRGIDQCEVDTPGGWWETSVGEEFGAAVLAELEQFVRDLTES